MKSFWKYLAAAALLAALLCCCFAASAETSGTDGKIHWVLDDGGVLTISGRGKMNDYSNKYANSGYVTTAPWGITAKSVIIQSGITSIGNYAFCGCSSLTGISIPDSVTSIGDSAFYACSGLTSIAIPDGVTSIGNYAFFGCSSLTGITIPKGVTSISRSAFSGCSSLASITIPDSVISIDVSAFSRCSSLTSIAIPEGVTSIGSPAFSGCTRLTTIAVMDGNTSYSSIDGVLFNRDGTCLIAFPHGKTSNYIVPSGVTSIGSSAFYACTSLTSITIPEGVTSIGDEAFCDCTSLASISIPKGIKSIGELAFFDCTSLASITIPNSVTSIGDSAFDSFYGCDVIRYTTIGSNGAKALGKAGYSFRDNRYPKISLRYFFNNNGEISNFTIEGADKDVETVTIPDGVTSIGDSAFSGCTSLTSIAIPHSVTSIGSGTFRYCSRLKSISVMDGNTNYSSIDGVLFNQDGTRLIAFPNGKANNYSVPSGVTSIGGSAFNNCTNLTSIIIPDDVTSIGGSAFYNCTSLTSIIIPNGVTSISGFAFSGCTSLTSVVLPDTLTTIDRYAFYCCNRLPSISLPASVTSVGEKAFYMDSESSFQKIFIAGDQVSFNSDQFNSRPIVYCYAYTGVDEYFTKAGYTVKYLDFEGMDNVRTVTLTGDNFRLACGRSKNAAFNVFPNDDHPSIIWTSSNPAVATVENGVVTALSAGQTTITASVGNAVDSITLTTYIAADSFVLAPSEEWVVAKDTLQLTAVDLIPENAEVTLTWTSSDTELATVNTSGLVTTKFPGEVTISADSTDGVHAEALLHLCYPVTAVTLSAPVNPMMLGQENQVIANVTMRDQTCVNHLVTFTSSDEAVLTVDADGTAHAVGAGEATITAASKSGKTASVTITVVESCGDHIPETLPAVAPTCEEAGLTEGVRCARCGAVLTAQEAIPALGHVWGEPTYEWNEDNSAVTACRVCSRDEAHTETETVSATGQTVLDPTCEEIGETAYTSQSFQNSAFAAQTKTAVDQPTLGHDWKPVTVSWSYNFKTATGRRVCRRSSSHTVTETVTASYTDTPADTENPGTRTYCAVFRKPEFEGYIAKFIQETSPALGQEWTVTGGIWNAAEGTVTLTLTYWDESQQKTSVLQKVFVLPNSLEAVEAEAFSGISAEAVILPDGCESIGSRAFADCPNLIYTQIPASVTDIAPDAFEVGVFLDRQ